MGMEPVTENKMSEQQAMEEWAKKIIPYLERRSIGILSPEVLQKYPYLLKRKEYK